MTAPLFTLQKALYAALNGDATLHALITGVYNDVPYGAAFPYLTLRLSEARDRSNLQNTLFEATVHINVYSSERGDKQALEILDRVHTLLHHAVLALENGHTLLSLYFKESSLAKEQGGEAIRGESVFVAVVAVN